MNTSSIVTHGPMTNMIAPLTGYSAILQKTHVTNGIREVIAVTQIHFYTNVTSFAFSLLFLVKTLEIYFKFVNKKTLNSRNHHK